MWWRQGINTRTRQNFGLRSKMIIDPKFQWKHTSTLMLAVNIPVLILLATSFYFVQQNYDAFFEVAYRYSPELVVHLQREEAFISYLFIASMIGLCIYTLVLGISTTYRLIGPVYALKRHLSNMIRGDWSQPLLKVREDDDYHDLVDTYNYFYSSLRRQAEWELEQISKCKVSPYAIESKERKRALVDYKAAQLSLSPEDFQLEDLKDSLSNESA